MAITLGEIAKNPTKFQRKIQIKNGGTFIFRPLENSDLNELVRFIDNLSLNTKKYFSYSESSISLAKEICVAINKYDKLRFVLDDTDNNKIIGLFELSFDIPNGDMERFEKYGVRLFPKTDCRFGPVLADEYQSIGIGSEILPLVIDIAKKFGQKRILLWGGVHVANKRAIRFYEKNNFTKLGTFINIDKVKCYDMLLTI